MTATPEDPRPDTAHDEHEQSAQPGRAARAGDAAKLWLRRAIGAVAVVAVLVIVYFILAAIVPRWWAERLGRVIDGSMLTGTGLGLAVGFVCTLVPLLLLIFAARRIRSHPALAGVAAVLAVIAAIPNLLTLTVVLGGGNASHAGERILDVDGPMFRGASAVGAVVGAVVAIALPVLGSVLRKKRASRKMQKATEKAAAKQAKLDAKLAEKEAKEAAKAERAGRHDTGE